MEEEIRQRLEEADDENTRKKVEQQELQQLSRELSISEIGNSSPCIENFNPLQEKQITLLNRLNSLLERTSSLEKEIERGKQREREQREAQRKRQTEVEQRKREQEREQKEQQEQQQRKRETEEGEREREREERQPQQSQISKIGKKINENYANYYYPISSPSFITETEMEEKQVKILDTLHKLFQHVNFFEQNVLRLSSSKEEKEKTQKITHKINENSVLYYSIPDGSYRLTAFSPNLQRKRAHQDDKVFHQFEFEIDEKKKKKRW